MIFVRIYYEILSVKMCLLSDMYVNVYTSGLLTASSLWPTPAEEWEKGGMKQIVEQGLNLSGS